MKTWVTKNDHRIVSVLSGRSNVFLVSNGNRNILVDTSVSRNWGKLQRHLSRLQVEQIDWLVLTHSHFDHAANAFRVREKYHARVILHRLEADLLMSGRNNLPGGTNPVTKRIANLLVPRLGHFIHSQPCPYDVKVDAVFDLNPCGFNATILHTPGHSAGSISLIVDDTVAIVGDAMVGVFRGSVFPPWAENETQMVQSWGKLLETPCSVFLPSHGSANSRKLVQKEYEKRKQA